MECFNCNREQNDKTHCSECGRCYDWGRPHAHLCYSRKVDVQIDSVGLFDKMVRAMNSIPKDYVPVIHLNQEATEWALEMELLGKLQRDAKGQFDSKQMFELWKERGGFQ